MDWIQFQQKIDHLTIKDVSPYKKEILSIYDEAIKELNDILQVQYLKWLSGVDPKNHYREMLKSNRLENMLRDLTTRYNYYFKMSEKLHYKAQEIFFSNAYFRNLYTMAWLKPVTAGAIPPALLELSVYGTADAFRRYKKEAIFGNPTGYQSPAGTLKKILYENKNYEADQIRRSISQGLTMGESYQAQRNRIVNVIGKEMKNPDGSINYTGARANAMRIVRSEGTRNLNSAYYASGKYAESKGIEIKKMWLAALDERTREDHGAADGQIKNLDEPFIVGGEKGMYPGQFPSAKNNANCRCTHAQLVNGEPPKSRMAKNPVSGEREKFSFASYDEWMQNNGIIVKNGKFVKK